MGVSIRNRKLLLVAALVTLSLRALAPDGYMPGSNGSGLLYELCPSGMPAAIMQALAGGSHHHHQGDDVRGSGSHPEQCPIGHMLASALAADSGAPDAAQPDASDFSNTDLPFLHRTPRVAYRSRAPPA